MAQLVSKWMVVCGFVLWIVLIRWVADSRVDAAFQLHVLSRIVLSCTAACFQLSDASFFFLDGRVLDASGRGEAQASQ